MLDSYVSRSPCRCVLLQATTSRVRGTRNNKRQREQRKWASFADPRLSFPSGKFKALPCASESAAVFVFRLPPSAFLQSSSISHSWPRMAASAWIQRCNLPHLSSSRTRTDRGSPIRLKVHRHSRNLACRRHVAKAAHLDVAEDGAWRKPCILGKDAWRGCRVSVLLWARVNTHVWHSWREENIAFQLVNYSVVWQPCCLWHLMEAKSWPIIQRRRKEGREGDGRPFSSKSGEAPRAGVVWLGE